MRWRTWPNKLERRGQRPFAGAVADRGYFNGEQIRQCELDGNSPLVPKPLTSGAKFEGRFDKRDFIYDAKRDAYRCPAGKWATYRFTAKGRGAEALRNYWYSGCGSCELKKQCTPAPWRKIARWEHEDVLERMQRRLNALPMASGWRRETAEHVFGTLKSWMGSAHFLTKRTRNVATEMSLQVLAYNMKRAMQILGDNRSFKRYGPKGSLLALTSCSNIVSQSRAEVTKLSAFRHNLGRMFALGWSALG